MNILIAVRSAARNMSGRKLKGARALGVALLTIGPFERAAAAQAIADNSFLIEEAYNQEAGVVQHIGTWHRSLRGAPWTFTFTQEWPVGSQRHQLSYTVPLQRTGSPERHAGFGDAAINYRYQLSPSAARVAVAPRLSLLAPTGSESRGLGTGRFAAQLNLPISARLGSALVTHGNAGISATSAVTTYSAGASVIWLAHPVFNIMCEIAWSKQSTGDRAVVLNPGVRWAHNFASGLQIVPGIAYTVGLGPSRAERAAFVYLSFEHRFTADAARN
jgi:hypothetical protein